MIPCNTVDISYEMQPTVAAQHARFTSMAPMDPMRTLPTAFPFGTGGCSTLHFYLDRPGYRAFEICTAAPERSGPMSKPYAKLVEDIQSGFGRTFSHLPTVFGVSRQTLYNWRKGEMPKPSHHSRLVEMAAAAREFLAAGFEPTPPMLERTITQGKSFIELLAAGADGADTAQRLMRIVKRGLEARKHLADLTEGQPDASGSLDIATPSWGEEA